MADDQPFDSNVTLADTGAYTMADYDETFAPYVKGFPEDIGHIPIVFVSNIKDAGRCFKWDNGYREIEINKKLWDTHSYIQKQWLIWHELGHCAPGNRKHVNSHINNNNETCNDDKKEHKCANYTPLSIMRWYMAHDWQIGMMCARDEVDTLSRLYCDSIDLQ